MSFRPIDLEEDFSYLTLKNGFRLSRTIERAATLPDILTIVLEIVLIVEKFAISSLVKGLDPY